MLLFGRNYSGKSASPITALIQSALGNDRNRLYSLTAKLGFRDQYFAETQMYYLLLWGKCSQLFLSKLGEQLPVSREKITAAYDQTQSGPDQTQRSENEPKGPSNQTGESHPYISSCYNPWRLNGNWLSVMGFKVNYNRDIPVAKTLLGKTVCHQMAAVSHLIENFLASEAGHAAAKLYSDPIGFAYHPIPHQTIHFDPGGKPILWTLQPLEDYFREISGSQ